MFHSLRFRMLTFMMVIVLIAIGAVALVAAFATQGAFRDYVNYEGSYRAERLEDLLTAYYGDRGNWEGVQPLIEQWAYINNWEIIVLNPFGEMVAIAQVAPTNSDVNQNIFTPDYAIQLELWQDFIRNSSEPVRSSKMPYAGSDAFMQSYTMNQPRFGRQNIPIMIEGKEVGAFAINTPDETILGPNRPVPPAGGDFMGTVNSSLLIGTGAAGLAAVVLSLMLSRTILKPVSALTHAVKRMEKGDLTQRVNVPARGEIGELARAFNAMAASLNTNEQLRRNMVSDIAHELRTPLTNIRGYIEAMQDGLLKPEEETLASVYEEVLLISHLIDDLQELALAEAGQLKMSFQPFDLIEPIGQCASALQTQAAARNVQLTVEVEEDLPEVYADPRRTAQILHNLVTNAIHYTVDSGHIAIRAYANNGRVAVSVKDTGIGIPPDQLPYVFERFYRVDASRNRSTGGAGLGLAISRQLVQAQGGTIHVESEVERGSTFTFTLPVYKVVHQAA